MNRKLVGTFASVVTFASFVQAQEPQVPRRAPEQLEARADLVLVDVTVIDRDGQPVPDLKAEDFELEVNGQPRGVHTLQFISTKSVQTMAAPDPRAAEYSSNEAASTGRLLLFVVDESYLRFGGGRTVLRTAERVLDTLAPGDLVGLARLPEGTGGVEFTADRNRIRRALERVTGKQPPRRLEKVRLDEAAAYERNDQYVWQQVIRRECEGLAAFELEACTREIEAQAKMVVTDASARTMTSVRAIEQLVARLAAYRTPVNLIFISEGLFIGRDRNDLTTLARLAATARVSFHVVQPDNSMFDEEPGRAIGGFGEASTLAEGLEQIAGHTRGTYYRVSTSGAGVFDRISREISAYYLLAFEPSEADRTSKDRRIKVAVKRRGLTVRSRSTYAINDSTVEDVNAPPEKRLQDLLAAPLPVGGLPIRLATYSLTNTQDNRVRVLLSAEIGEPIAAPAEIPVGLWIIDKDDKIIVSTASPMKLAPASPRSSTPRLMLNAVLLDPGEYSVRLAAVGPDGRTGSIHHVIDARLDSLGGNDDFKASDLLVAAEPPARGEAPRPAPSAIVDSETLVAALELASDDVQRLGKASVVVEIAENETAVALAKAQAQSQARAEGKQRAFSAVLKVGLLPPGDYVARAIVEVPGQRSALVTRPFRLVAPVAAAAAAAPAAPVDPDAIVPPPPPKISVPLPRFTPDEVLRPRIVSTFLDALVQRHPVSPATMPIVEGARKGVFGAPPADSRTADQDEIVLAFIRGLAALQKKELPQAAAWFQMTLKNASDFLGAAFYLGAVHAASGRDRDAAGAWQMSLLADGGDLAYPLLVDALLRAGDGQAALDLIAEAPDAWSDEVARWRRVAVAQAMLGQYTPALEMLTTLLQKQPNDLDLLFAALQVMYRQNSEGRLSDADRARFIDYATRYENNNGPQSALVATWRKFVGR